MWALNWAGLRAPMMADCSAVLRVLMTEGSRVEHSDGLLAGKKEAHWAAS
tara:strand:- start:287 stop:436 length:150 start_codon:yes stop_codon:yes gene_type:complete